MEQLERFELPTRSRKEAMGAREKIEAKFERE
jgi:hypothetical protein